MKKRTYLSRRWALTCGFIVRSPRQSNLRRVSHVHQHWPFLLQSSGQGMPLGSRVERACEAVYGKCDNHRDDLADFCGPRAHWCWSSKSRQRRIHTERWSTSGSNAEPLVVRALYAETSRCRAREARTGTHKVFQAAAQAIDVPGHHYVELTLRRVPAQR